MSGKLYKSDRRRGGGALIAALLLLACALVPSAVSADPLEDPAAVIYDPGAVSVVDLALSPEAISELEAEPDEYVEGEFAMKTGGSDGEETTLSAPMPAEVRLKGHGSFEGITEKPGFKLKFGKHEPFLGLRKMTLNNMVQDESMAHEALSYGAFGEAGVPGPRAGYAYVRLNGEEIGVYADIENLDDIALEKRFGTFEKPPQHLYEGEDGHDVLPGEAEEFEVDEGEEVGDGGEHPIADLETLIEVVNGSGAEPWSTRVAPYVDLKEMTKMWAAEKYIADWDGYSGHAEAGLRPNNYYLYSEADGQFQMMPWGTDQTWDRNEEIEHRWVTFEGEGGVLFNLCLEDEACFRMYWEALDDVTDELEARDPGAFLASTAAMLAPWQEREREDGRGEEEASEVEAAVAETAAFIADRPAEAREWLEAHEPPPLPEPEEEEAEEGSEGEEEEEPTPAVSESTGTLPVTPPYRGPLSTLIPTDYPRYGRVKTAGRRLEVRLGFPVAGTVRVRAQTRLHGRRATVCRITAQIRGRGRRALGCGLPRWFLKRLSRNAMRLTLRTAFSSRRGQLTYSTRSLRLPKR